LAESSLSVPTASEMIEQVAFEREADNWITEIANQIPDNNVLYQLLQKVPHNARRGLYNALRPRLKFQAKPYILFL
jgi:hypothetical protein